MKKNKLRESRRAELLVVAIVVAVLASVRAGAAAQTRYEGNLISIKIGAGYDYTPSGIGDLEMLRSSLSSYYPSLGGLAGYTGTCSWAKISRIPGYDLELLFRPLPQLAVSFGTSYMVVNSTGTYGFTYHQEGVQATEQYVFDQSVTTSRTYKLTVIPIKLSLYGILPLGRTFDLYAYAGAGFYFGKFSHSLTEQTSVIQQHNPFASGTFPSQDNSTVNDQIQDDLTKETLGIHGGLGLDIKLGRWLSLGLECYGRSLSMADWEGHRVDTISTRQRLYRSDLGWYSDQTSTNIYETYASQYYYETLDPKLNKYFASIELLDFEPESGDVVRNVRRPSFNLSSYGIRLTLQFYFTID
jgi:hypothetical protein